MLTSTSKYDLSMWAHTVNTCRVWVLIGAQNVCPVSSNFQLFDVLLTSFLMPSYQTYPISFFLLVLVSIFPSQPLFYWNRNVRYVDQQTGVCNVPAALQCEGQTRTRWWKNNPATTFTHFITSQRWIEPAASVPSTLFAGTACVISVPDRKTGWLIRLHLGFVFFIKNMPGRVHNSPLEPWYSAWISSLELVEK